jgi:autotransporter-associated beta strand protein
MTTTQTYGGVISGSPNGAPPPSGNSEDSPNPGGLTKSGTGKLTLTANQTYTGDTLLTSGMLALSGNGGLGGSSNLIIAATGTLDVTARTGGILPLTPGQKLMGRGTVLGALSVNNLATLAPGESVGTLTTGAETWSGGGTYEWEITHATSPNSSDRVTVNGAINITATSVSRFTVKLISPAGPLPGFNSASNHTWIIAPTTGGVLNFDPAKFIVDASGLGVNAAGGTFAVAIQGNDVVVTFAPYALPLTPPAFTGIGLSNGLISLSATGAVGQTFYFQATTNLAPAYWQGLSTQAVVGSGSVLFSDPQSTNLPQRFYRIGLQP